MLSGETPGEQTKYGVFLAAALTGRSPELITAFEAEAANRLAPGASA